MNKSGVFFKVKNEEVKYEIKQMNMVLKIVNNFCKILCNQEMIYILVV